MQRRAVPLFTQAEICRRAPAESSRWQHAAFDYADFLAQAATLSGHDCFLDSQRRQPPAVFSPSRRRFAEAFFAPPPLMRFTPSLITDIIFAFHTTLIIADSH